MEETINTVNTEASYKELYFDLEKKYNELKEERDYWKEQYVNADSLNKLLSEDPFNEEPKGNTPIENRKAQGKLTGEWTSYDKVENFDIFS